MRRWHPGFQRGIVTPQVRSATGSARTGPRIWRATSSRPSGPFTTDEGDVPCSGPASLGQSSTWPPTRTRRWHAHGQADLQGLPVRRRSWSSSRSTGYPSRGGGRFVRSVVRKMAHKEYQFPQRPRPTATGTCPQRRTRSTTGEHRARHHHPRQARTVAAGAAAAARITGPRAQGRQGAGRRGRAREASTQDPETEGKEA